MKFTEFAAIDTDSLTKLPTTSDALVLFGVTVDLAKVAAPLGIMTLVLCLPAQLAHALAINDVSFQQADWFRPNGTLAQQDSLWGRMTFSYAPESATSFLNVSLSNSPDAPGVWAIKNLPLFAVDNGNFSVRREAVDINLQELGMSANQNWSGAFFTINVNTSIRTTPLDPPTIFKSVDPVDYRFGVDVEAPEIGPFSDPGTPQGVKIDKQPKKIGKSHDLKPVQEASNQCTAGSFARSLDWLNREHNLGINRSPQQIYDDLIGKGVGKPIPDQTASRDEWVGFKDTYARDKSNNKIVTKVWDSGTSIDPIPGVNEGNGAFIDWIIDEMKHGEDIEVAYYYPGNAHIVTIAELFMANDELFAKYRDDEKQGDDTKGDTEVKTAKLYKGANGEYHFGADTNTIFFAVSESVPEPSSMLLFGLGLAGLIGFRRKQSGS